MRSIVRDYRVKSRPVYKQNNTTTKVKQNCAKNSNNSNHRFMKRVTRRVSHMEQELHTVPEHLRSHQVFSGVRVARYLVFCVMFCRSLFVLFLLTIILSALRFTASDYLSVSSNFSVSRGSAHILQNNYMLASFPIQ